MKWLPKLFIAVGLILGLIENLYATTIHFNASSLGGNRWEYNYSITNDTLTSSIEEFTIFFNYGQYDHLIVTMPLAGWDEITADPALILNFPDNGFYDALALSSGIVPGSTASGFSVSFDWLGIGTPGSQQFAIVDPTTLVDLDTGTTIITPEPSTVLLLSLGLAVFVGFGRTTWLSPKYYL
jgi:hypothetical protein